MQEYVIILRVLFVASIAAFCLYAWDKHQAVYEKRRVPEILLHVAAFAGGAFGALCAMILFKHKTKHLSFLICVPLFVTLQLALVVLLRIGLL